MNVDLKDEELGLIEAAIINDIRSRLEVLAKTEIDYHMDLKGVSNELEFVQTMIKLEEKVWKIRRPDDNN